MTNPTVYLSRTGFLPIIYDNISGLPDIVEIAQDAVGGILVDTATINFTYDDTTPQIYADLKNTTVVAGTYGSASQTVTYTVDSKGRLTAASNVTISITASQINNATIGAGSSVSGTNTGDQNLFGTIAVSGQSNVVADSTNDTLTLVAGTNVTITTDASTDNITINATGGTGTVTTTGSPASGNLTKFSGATSITSGDLSGDVITSGTLATTIASSVALSGSPTTTTQTAGDNSTKIATTAYVTTGIANAIAGVNPAVAVQAATTAAGDTSALTYNNGVGGIGATLTGANNTALTVDGYTFTALGQRLLVKNDTQSPSGAFNGVYYVTQVQAALLPLILTRALDYDMPSDINNTGAIPVVNGTLNALTSWLLTSQITTVGTDPLTYVEFSVNPNTILTFKTISVSGQSDIVADSLGDTLTVAAGSGITLTTNAGTDTLTITNSGSAVTPAALTKTDDTNVTLTLGGTPATALLQATSITVGWTGALAETRGGTAQSTYATGDILYASAANTLSKLAKNTTATRYLANTGAGNIPAWDQVNLTNGVSGALPIANLAAFGINDLSDAVYDTATDHNMVLGSNTAPASGGKNNIFIGEGVATGTTTSATDNNTALGYQALNTLSSGTNNTIMGQGAGAAITSSAANTIVGQNAFPVGTSNNVVAVGVDALKLVTGSGSDGLVAIGYRSMDAITSGTVVRNVAVGADSLGAVTSGIDNTGIGDSTALTLTTGSQNTFLGSGAGPSASNATNQTSVGYGAACLADNQVTLCNASVTTVRCGTANTASVKALNTPKAYGKVTGATGSRVNAGSFNVTSITDTGIGAISYVFTTAFANSAYTVVVGGERTSSTGTATLARDISITTGGEAAGSIALQCWDKTATTNVIKDPNAWHMVALGTQ